MPSLLDHSVGQQYTSEHEYMSTFERNDDMMNLGEMSPHVVWQQYDVLHNLLSIDESMMPYYGSHSCKMFIKGKPIRFGYMMWCVCESDGYL